MIDKNKILGGLYGLALGDAVGVPYEFSQPFEIPPYAQIDLVPPAGFDVAYLGVPPGTWSDDTSLALCLLDGLLVVEDWDKRFVENMLAWRHSGKYAVDGKKFDIGIQTSYALNDLEDGMEIKDRVDSPTRCGNGALMRSLPVALTCELDNTTSDIKAMFLVNRHHVQATHANKVCEYTSLLYTTWAYYCLRGEPYEDAMTKSISAVAALGEAYPDTSEAIAIVLAGEKTEPTGSGYAVDALWSAYYAVKQGHDFESTIKRAIQYGRDTDTTACIAGGIAGIIYGFDGLPNRWLDQLREKNVVDDFAKRLMEYHALE